MKQHSKFLPQNDRGMVSITVTVIFIMVISLTVLGFSQVTRRNSREALDRQLSTQAFYAAEVGVNDARNKIANLVETNAIIPEQTECKDTAKYTKTVKDAANVDIAGGVDPANGVLYTCLLVKNKLTDIRESNVGSTSVVLTLNASAGQLGEPMMEWQPSTGNAGKRVADCVQPNDSSQPWTNFPKSEAWNTKCPYGVLRVDVTPSNDPAVFQNVDTALARTMTIFIYPKADNGTVPNAISYQASPGVVTQGRVVAASCTNEKCRLRLSGLNFPSAYMKVRSVYANTQLFEVNAQTTSPDGGGTASYTFDSQVEIDATGKAQDVLRRIQVRVPAVGGSSRTDVGGFSDFTMQSTGSICKRFVASPTVAADQSGCTD